MKTNQEKLATLQKANWNYKLKLAQKAGFTSVVDYKASLTGVAKVKSPNAQLVKPTINIVNIVDRSGSMGGGKISAANEAVQKDIQMIKGDTSVNYTYTLVVFDDRIENKLFMVKPAEAYSGNIAVRGSTALNQAIGETLDLLLTKVKPEDKTIITIITDGEENSSHGRYTSKVILADKIAEAESKGFTVAFIGTNNDVDKVLRDFKLKATNALKYDGTARGMSFAMNERTESLTAYSVNVKQRKDVSEGFFKKLKV